MSKKRFVPMESKERKKDPVNLIYCGPTIEDVVYFGTVFNDGVSKKFEDLVAQKPFVSQFLVTPEKFESSLYEIRTEGTVLNLLYKKLIK